MSQYLNHLTYESSSPQGRMHIHEYFSLLNLKDILNIHYLLKTIISTYKFFLIKNKQTIYVRFISQSFEEICPFLWPMNGQIFFFFFSHPLQRNYFFYTTIIRNSQLFLPPNWCDSQFYSTTNCILWATDEIRRFFHDSFHEVRNQLKKFQIFFSWPLDEDHCLIASCCCWLHSRHTSTWFFSLEKKIKQECWKFADPWKSGMFKVYF